MSTQAQKPPEEAPSKEGTTVYAEDSLHIYYTEKDGNLYGVYQSDRMACCGIKPGLVLIRGESKDKIREAMNKLDEALRRIREVEREDAEKAKKLYHLLLNTLGIDPKEESHEVEAEKVLRVTSYFTYAVR